MTAREFCLKYKHKKIYQPVVFVPGVLELRGKWDKQTKQTADIILQEVEGKSLLDVGCNHGYFLHEAIRRGARKASGIDHDPSEIAFGQEVNDILQHPIEMECAKIEEYQISFTDIVLLMNVLHVVKNPASVVEKCFSGSSELIIEHEEEHEAFFPIKPYKQEVSPRSGGHRLLSWLH